MAFENNDDLLNELEDPLADPLAEPASGPESGGGRRRRKKRQDAQENNADGGILSKRGKKRRRKQKSGEIVRVENLPVELDTASALSTYLPARRARLLGKALLRLDRTRLLLLLAMLIVAILFIMSFMQEKMGNFTINLDRLELFRKGIAIDYDPDFSHPTARLVASPVADATNISINDLPSNIADIDGDHNGLNYMAYTYYLRNAGKEDVSYVASVVIESSSKDADEAVRVALWHNGERTVYAKPSADGTPEDGCVNFESNNIVCSYEEENFLVGNVDKYTIVIWMEGDDPECVDRIVGGSVQFTMKVAASNEDDTTLLHKYIQDIVDTIRGDKPISAAGTESPDFQKYDQVTWDTRRNQ